MPPARRSKSRSAASYLSCRSWETPPVSLVLQYFADPALLLRHLLTWVKPGGLVAFQEVGVKDEVYSEPVCPVYERALQRIAQTFTRIGAEVRTGHRLAQIIQEACLPAPQMIVHARVERGPDSPIYDLVAQLTRVMLPLMQRTGVATVEEVGVEALAERMRAEAVALNATEKAAGGYRLQPIGECGQYHIEDR
jgi:hypothetical protein